MGNMRGMPNVASPPVVSNLQNSVAGQASSSSAPTPAPTSTTNSGKKSGGGRVAKPKRSRGRSAAAAVAAFGAALGAHLGGGGGGGGGDLDDLGPDGYVSNFLPEQQLKSVFIDLFVFTLAPTMKTIRLKLR